jgi:hypothetical protein
MGCVFCDRSTGASTAVLAAIPLIGLCAAFPVLLLVVPVLGLFAFVFRTKQPAPPPYTPTVKRDYYGNPIKDQQ